MWNCAINRTCSCCSCLCLVSCLCFNRPGADDVGCSFADSVLCMCLQRLDDCGHISRHLSGTHCAEPPCCPAVQLDSEARQKLEAVGLHDPDAKVGVPS
jgi:hypothetical protein